MIRVRVGDFLEGVERERASAKTIALVALQASGKILQGHVDLRVSLQDHSLADLARLDHPYARRHGSIQIHGNHPEWVHEQSGTLRRSVYGRLEPTGSGGGRFVVGFDETIAPHAKYVVFGTRVMLPRDPLLDATRDKRARTEMLQAFVDVMGPRYRSQSDVRFGFNGK